MKKYMNVNLIFIIIVAVIFQIFLFSQKENFHIDEMLSFIAANNEEGIYLSRNWSDMNESFVEGKDFTKRLVKQPNSSILHLWNKISQGVHMPVYYVLLHIFYFSSLDTFNPLGGKILNIIVLIFLLMGFYKISLLVFKDKNVSLVSTAIFAFIQPVLSLEVYIRMYLLLMAFSVWLTYFTGIYFIEKKNKQLLPIFILTFLTVLTHYYSLIFCFLLTSFVCLRFLFDKEYKNLFLFGFTMLIAVYVAYLTFPSMVNSGFHSERGSQFWLILNEFKENPLKVLKQQIPLFLNTVFINFYFFVGFVFFFIIGKNKENDLQNKFINCLFWVFIFYGFLTALVMPVMLHYQIRYFAPIIPLFVLLLIDIIRKIGDSYKISQNKIFCVLCFMMFFIGVKNIVWQDSPFYMHGTKDSRKMENLIKGADVWWGFGGGWQYSWMLSLYVDKLAKADKTWILSDYDNPKFLDFSRQEVKDKKYAYLFLPKTQETNINGAVNWIKDTTGRTAYYLFTSKIPNTAAMVFEASVYLVCPF